MELTDYHAKVMAYQLTRRCGPDSVEGLASALVDAQVDLNPHQVDAALFAFRSPFSRGALLADEVGLGKTIEAGLVLSQRWAERRRRILVVTPANLRKQWVQELTEKFFLPCRILEARSFHAAFREGRLRPFEGAEIVVCSYQFARSKAGDVQAVPWDLVVIDEAHRLRNVYKPGNVIANTLRLALQGRPKLLLTATPLQNSLLELFGLVSFIDEHAFGDLASFREQFASVAQQGAFEALKARLAPLCHRTLRRQVLPYIKYTQRFPIVQEFTPEENEDRLYNLVSDYLRRDNLQALPSSQRSLMTLVLRKLLASSSFAIAGALDTLSRRLRARLAEVDASATGLSEGLEEDYESLDDTAEEWGDDEAGPSLSREDRETLQSEIADLEEFSRLALSIDHNAKGRALLAALQTAFAKAAELGASPKAIVFTESRRTQSYLLRLLADSPFSEGVVLFNGSNTDERSRGIYADWLARHQGSDRVSGSHSADMRSALVDYFREQGRIMIATEAGAEGINLQSCALVVNYDLPWNPQRIEQRIGRCHRYGQQHDVVVVNFLNRFNAADRRVFELLSEKFQLFEGVFGASDEVLGAIESGVDFEKRIASIYQGCRRPGEIQSAFDRLQSELDLEIHESMTRTRRQLFEHFDDEVREKLRIRDQDSRVCLGRYERVLMRLTRHELAGVAEFRGDSSFILRDNPFPSVAGAIPLGVYELPRRSGEAHLYRPSHPLAEALIARARERDLPDAVLELDYSGHEGRISVLDPLLGTAGILVATYLTVEALEASEDHLVCVAMNESGEPLDEEVAQRLLTLGGRNAERGLPDPSLLEAADRVLAKQRAVIQHVVAARNLRDFDAEVSKRDCWADDLKLGLEREIKNLDRRIKDARRGATAAPTLEEKLAGQRQIRTLETQRTQKRRSLFDAQDEIDARREGLIAEVEVKLVQRVSSRQLFAVRWRLC